MKNIYILFLLTCLDGLAQEININEFEKLKQINYFDLNEVCIKRDSQFVFLSYVLIKKSQNGNIEMQGFSSEDSCHDYSHIVSIRNAGIDWRLLINTDSIAKDFILPIVVIKKKNSFTINELIEITEIDFLLNYLNKINVSNVYFLPKIIYYIDKFRYRDH